jgi:hypothetical protein
VDLDAENWSSGVLATVSAINDDIDDGPQECLVQTGPATSTDPVYTGRTGDELTVIVEDDDTAGVGVDVSGMGDISEPDGSDTFTLKLTSEPTAMVTVDLSVLGGQCTVSPVSANLDSGNWSAGVVATVTALDDDIDDDVQVCHVRTSRTSSSDPKYVELNVDDVYLDVDDDDEAGIEVLPTSLEIGEPDGADTITLMLTSEPVAEVTIGLSASNGECTVAPSSVTLDATDWAQGKTATVTAVDDDEEDGTQSCSVQTGSATSGDPKYLGRPVPDVVVSVEDDDLVYRVYMPVLIRRWPPVPDAPTLDPIQNEDGNGSYTISWSSEAHADVYVLEEGTDDAFSSIKATYSTDTSQYEITDQAAGRFHYRVKARNGTGDSGWSTTQRVDVLWHREASDQPGDNGPAAPGLTYFGILPNADDIRDYFTFELDSPHQVELRLTNIAAGQNYDLVLRYANLSPVPGGYDPQPGNRDEHIQTGVLPAGTYHIQVYRNPNSSGGTSQPYHLRADY